MSRPTLAALLALALVGAAHAHDGPPYPVLVDEPFAGRTLSVWADPDVGVGSFYLYVEPAEGAAQALLPLRMEATPLMQGARASTGLAVAAARDEPYQLFLEIEFERRGEWELRLLQDDGAAQLSFVVEVTPPGSLGPIDLLWYLLPFLAVGFLWFKGMSRQRAHERSLSPPSP